MGFVFQDFLAEFIRTDSETAPAKDPPRLAARPVKGVRPLYQDGV